MSSQATDELLTQQIEAAANALSDDCPAVRAAAATGCFAVLDRFWELLPTNVIAGFLKRLLGMPRILKTPPYSDSLALIQIGSINLPLQLLHGLGLSSFS